MSITKRPNIGGDSNIRRQCQMADNVCNRQELDPNSRNARRVMKKIRAKYGDEVVDREIERLKGQSA